jgi:hypothetical protein
LNGQDLRILLRLLDADDDHFDQRISDQEFLRLAASARNSLTPSAAHDPGLAAAVRALDSLLNAAKDDPLPAGLHGDLRTALAELEDLRLCTQHSKYCQRINDSGQ